MVLRNSSNARRRTLPGLLKSLIIHKIKTKEINTETEFGYVRKNVHKLTQLSSQFSPKIRICFRCNMKHSEECLLTYPNTSKCVKKLGCASFFQHTSRCLKTWWNSLPRVSYFTSKSEWFLKRRDEGELFKGRRLCYPSKVRRL